MENTFTINGNDYELTRVEGNGNVIIITAVPFVGAPIVAVAQVIEPTLKITLTHGEKFTIVDAADYNLIKGFRWAYHPRGYAVTGQQKLASWHKKHVFLHDYLMRPPRDFCVDHIDGNGLNNTRANLRVCTHSENHGNKRKLKGASSKYKGVSWCNTYNKWVALVCCKGKQYHCGRFSSEIKAALAYDTRAKELFGEFALTNFP